MRSSGSIAVLALLLSPSSARAAPGGSLTFEGFYLRPLGALTEQYSNAVGGYGGLALFFPEHYELAIKAGCTSYLAARGQPREQALSVVHLLAGPRLYFLTARFRPYIALNVGLNLVVESTKVLRRQPSLHFAWQMLAGSTFHVAGAFGVDLALKYNAHFFEQDRAMTGFEVGLALTYELF